MRDVLSIGRFALALVVFSFAGSARGGLIEFTPTTASPNTTGSANTGAYGSDANVSVGYSAYTYNYPSGYGTLGGGTGDGLYSDNYISGTYKEVMTFTAAAG